MSQPPGNVRREYNGFYYWSEETGWDAFVKFRDPPGTERPLSVEVTFWESTERGGAKTVVRQIAGEMSPYTACHWAARWAIEGKLGR